MTTVSYRAAELLEAISKMLEARAEAGNAQSKHGLDAAYDYECFCLVEALNELLDGANRMRYEHIELDISTAGCDLLMDIIGNSFDHDCETLAEREVANLYNQLRARLQRRDVDPHCPKNQVSTEEWLDT